MPAELAHVIDILQTHESDLRKMGVSHAAVFGSVARGEAQRDSDIDILVDLDPAQPIGIFEYARLKLYIAGLLEDPADIINRASLKPLLRDAILRDGATAF
jgi:hypothetical protein